MRMTSSLIAGTLEEMMSRLCHARFIPRWKQNALFELVDKTRQTFAIFGFGEWETCPLWPTFAVCRIHRVPSMQGSCHVPWQSRQLFAQHCFAWISLELASQAVQNLIKVNTMQALRFRRVALRKANLNWIFLRDWNPSHQCVKRVICCQFILNVSELREPKQNKVLKAACHTANWITSWLSLQQYIGEHLLPWPLKMQAQ